MEYQNSGPSGTLSVLKKPLFQKRRWSCGFPPRKTPVNRLPKSTARFPAKKRWHSPLPVGLPWASSLPHPQSLYGRTLTSQPNFFGSIDYQISLTTELRWRALPAGSAIKVCKVKKNNKFFL